ncbi:MAG TPA: serine/threonine-protein kinase [Pirellulales bacterium]|nr:serine/threonine-protein kinase [Pirellulales bacterium]
MNQPLADSPLALPDADTPRDDFDETLGHAIDAGRLDASLAADPKLAGAFAADQRLESLFALMRGELPLPPGEGWGEGREDEPAPTQLGRYQKQSTLGAGAFGNVYLARYPDLNRDVAIKVSRVGTFTTAGALDKFRTEARHAASLNHPQIVTIHDVGRENNRLYIVMEYVPGQTLAELIDGGPVAPGRAAELLEMVADALRHAHKLGFVHRDLKPANILLDEQGRPHVADFGLLVSEETQRAGGARRRHARLHERQSRVMPCGRVIKASYGSRECDRGYTTDGLRP